VGSGHSLELRFRQVPISGVSAEDLRTQRERGQKIVLQRDAAWENVPPRSGSYGACARITGKELARVSRNSGCG
jgi:hypothetical protein